MTEPHLQDAISMFEQIKNEFPHLDIQMDLDNPYVDIAMKIPVQPGLAFELYLQLDDDELTLSTGMPWFQWYPCTEPTMEAEFREAAEGLLSGRYRIMEIHQGRRPVHAKIQRPQGDEWETIHSWTILHLPMPWRKTTRILQNSSPTA